MTFWNDMLRNDYRGTGYIDGGRKQISSWLFKALYNNMPYDKFVAELINPTPESEGFSKGIVWRGVVNASQTPAMQAAQNTAQTHPRPALSTHSASALPASGFGVVAASPSNGAGSRRAIVVKQTKLVTP